MPGNTPSGLLPTGLARGIPPTGKSTREAPGTGVASPAGLRGPAPGGAQGQARAAPRGNPVARRRNRTWFRIISPLAVLIGWQLVSMSGLVSVQKLEQVVGQDHARILVNGSGYGAPYSFAVASRAALADPAKAAAIRDYLKLLNQAYVWGGSHVTTWASVWAKPTGLPDSVMLKAAQDDVRTPVQITPAVVSAEQSVSNAFTTAGLIPGHVNFRDFSDSGFNDTVGGA